jgi:hypothetical protein
MAWEPGCASRPAVEAYLEARRAWNHTVRGVIGTGAADTAEQVQALRPEAYAAFVEAEDAEPVGTEEVVWATDAAFGGTYGAWGLDSGPWGEIGWRMMNAEHRGIIWADRRALQNRVAELPWCPPPLRTRTRRERNASTRRTPLRSRPSRRAWAGFNRQAFALSCWTSFGPRGVAPAHRPHGPPGSAVAARHHRHRGQLRRRRISAPHRDS